MPCVLDTPTAGIPKSVMEMSEGEAHILRKMVSTYMEPIDPDDPKGPSISKVPVEIGDLVHRAMNFVGFYVDERFRIEDGDIVVLRSEGYRYYQHNSFDMDWFERK